MNKKDEALRMAIEALEYEEFCSNFLRVEAINACKAALDTEQVREGVVPEQEPVAWRSEGGVITEARLQAESWVSHGGKATPLYTRPTKPLSDDAIRDCLYGCKTQNFLQFARAIEKAHGIGE